MFYKMNIKLYILLIVITFASIINYAQDYNKYCLYTNYAAKAYEQKDFEQAIALMDSALLKCPEQHNTPENWYNLAVFYKSLHKQNKDLNLVKKGLDAALIARELDQNKELTKQINSAIKNIALVYQREAGKITKDTSANTIIALQYYNLYKKTYKLAFLDKNFINEDINLFNVMGNMYKIKYLNNPKFNHHFIDSSIIFYKESLKLDSNQTDIYSRIGKIYFNQAVEVVLELDTEADIETTQNADNKKANFAIKGLPFLLKSFELDQNNSNTIYSLAGFYELLALHKKHDFYLNLLKEKDPEYYKKVFLTPSN